MEETGSFEEYPHFFQVQLELFCGPIDLLLHLVKQKELSLEKVSLAEVTVQYLNCLEQMRRFDLEIAGEYLVIAATLLSIKSSLLLDDPIEFVEDEDGNLVDPHEELLRRLKEAEVYKEGANHLSSCGQLGLDVFSSEPILKDFEDPEVVYADHSPMLLGKAFRDLLAEIDGKGALTYEISLESVSIVDRMMKVIDSLRSASQQSSQHSSRALSFRALIPDVTSKAELIGTFIAMLELCKRQVIHVSQDEESEEILVGLAENNTQFDLAGIESEFDVDQAESAAG